MFTSYCVVINIFFKNQTNRFNALKRIQIWESEFQFFVYHWMSGFIALKRVSTNQGV